MCSEGNELILAKKQTFFKHLRSGKNSGFNANIQIENFKMHWNVCQVYMNHIILGIGILEVNGMDTSSP